MEGRGSSFAMFSLGAAVPLVPFFFASRRPALIAAVLLSMSPWVPR